jgi:hypothetical protein
VKPKPATNTRVVKYKFTKDIQTGCGRQKQMDKEAVFDRLQGARDFNSNIVNPNVMKTLLQSERHVFSSGI